MSTVELDAADALVILTRIKLYHSPQDDSDATCQAWAEALNYAGVTNLRDADEAVKRHYTTPGANPFITPGDIAGRYREIRRERVAGINDGDLTPDVDPLAPDSMHTATLKARYAAVLEGMPKAQAIATIPQAKAIEAAK